MEFKTFEFIVISNQICTHHDYLANLRSLFREHDYKNFGYISKEQYSDILNEIDPHQQVPREKTIKQTDPLDFNQITFSQVVEQFTNLELVGEDGNTQNFLQRVYSKE